MITPLGVRQVLTTAALEAVRQGHEGAVQGQQLLAKRQAVLDRMTEAQEEVPQVEGSEELRLDPDHHQSNQSGAESQGPMQGEEPRREAPSEGAEPAEGHLDFLA